MDLSAMDLASLAAVNLSDSSDDSEDPDWGRSRSPRRPGGLPSGGSLPAALPGATDDAPSPGSPAAATAESVEPTSESRPAEEKAIALEGAEAQLRAAGLNEAADKLAQQAAEHRAAAATLQASTAAAEQEAAALEDSASQLRAAGLSAEADELVQRAAEQRSRIAVAPRGGPARRPTEGGAPPTSAPGVDPAVHPGAGASTAGHGAVAPGARAMPELAGAALPTGGAPPAAAAGAPEGGRAPRVMPPALRADPGRLPIGAPIGAAPPPRAPRPAGRPIPPPPIAMAAEVELADLEGNLPGQWVTFNMWVTERSQIHSDAEKAQNGPKGRVWGTGNGQVGVTVWSSAPVAKNIFEQAPALTLHMPASSRIATRAPISPTPITEWLEDVQIAQAQLLHSWAWDDSGTKGPICAAAVATIDPPRPLRTDWAAASAPFNAIPASFQGTLILNLSGIIVDHTTVMKVNESRRGITLQEPNGSGRINMTAWAALALRPLPTGVVTFQRVEVSCQKKLRDGSVVPTPRTLNAWWGTGIIGWRGT
ncbi:unnamed protein product [Prorocentrum cordatum]|uniref:Uncharacterized protein n=1 Tax=Prorocentrum cordatum TaxID=2364126 RepID=A0ABN9TNW2_9DINO|nr:unnamed protein product [Polarella glacialis]